MSTTEKFSRGEVVLVYCDEQHEFVERIYLTQFEDASLPYPYVCVQEGYEDAYIAGAYFCTENFNLIMKTSSEEREIRQTLKEIIRMKKRVRELEEIIRQRQSK